MIWIYNKFNRSRSAHRGRTPGPDGYKLRTPNKEEGEAFALVTLLTGAEYIKVLCEDGVERAARIPGKLRDRVYIKENDIIIVKKREYEDNKVEVVWRFLPLQVAKLKSQGYLQNLPI